jgi:hypothetical protein
MAGAKWFELLEEMNEYGIDDTQIVDQLVRGMDERVAEEEVCFLAQTFEFSTEKCKKVQGGQFYVEPGESMNIGVDI